MLPAVLYDDHSSVIKVGESLRTFLAFFNRRDIHDLARKYYRLERVRELIYVEHRNTLYRRYLVQVIVVCDDLAIHDRRELEQLYVYFRDSVYSLFVISVVYLNTVLRLYLFKISRPRRPRLRLRLSEESAIWRSSTSTNSGMTICPSINPVFIMSGDTAVYDDARIEYLRRDILCGFF